MVYIEASRMVGSAGGEGGTAAGSGGGGGGPAGEDLRGGSVLGVGPPPPSPAEAVRAARRNKARGAKLA